MLFSKQFYIFCSLVTALFCSAKLHAEDQKTFVSNVRILKVNELEYHSLNVTSKEIEFKWHCQKKDSNINKCVLYDKQENAVLKFLFGFHPNDGRLLVQKCFIKDKEGQWKIYQSLYYFNKEGIKSSPTAIEIIDGVGKKVNQGWNSTIKHQLKIAGLSGSHDSVIKLLDFKK